MATEERIVLFELNFLCLQLLVARGQVTGRRFAFLARFSAFERDHFSRHAFYSFSLAGFSSASSSSSTSTAPAESTEPSVPRRRWRKAPSFSSCAWASTVNRVHGIASNRALGIGFPVSSQMPYVFFSIRLSASSIS